MQRKSLWFDWTESERKKNDKWSGESVAYQMCHAKLYGHSTTEMKPSETVSAICNFQPIEIGMTYDGEKNLQFFKHFFFLQWTRYK